MQTVLFQGDSITDAGRSRENDMFRGYGYATMVAGELGYTHPGEYTCINRGVSGDRVVDLLARVKYDIINLQPDVMSILIGINDVWHEVSCGNGIAADKYVVLYDMLIQQIKEALPNIKIMILEPFVLSGTATESHWDYFREETALRAQKAKSIAEKYDLCYVSLQDKFDAAVQLAPASHWLYDGVHPTAAGHTLIARAWMEAFQTL